MPLMLAGTGYGVIGLVAAIMLTEVIVALVTVVMAASVFELSFARIAESFQPAVVASAVMATCLIGAKMALEYQINLAVLLVGVGLGALIYLLTLRIFYGRLLEDAIRLFTGRRKADSPA